MLSCFSCVPLFATLWSVALQAPLSMGFSRQEYWGVLPFFSARYLPNPGVKPGSPVFQADALPSETPGKPIFQCISIIIWIQHFTTMFSNVFNFIYFFLAQSRLKLVYLKKYLRYFMATTQKKILIYMCLIPYSKIFCF